MLTTGLTTSTFALTSAATAKHFIDPFAIQSYLRIHPEHAEMLTSIIEAPYIEAARSSLMTTEPAILPALWRSDVPQNGSVPTELGAGQANPEKPRRNHSRDTGDSSWERVTYELTKKRGRKGHTRKVSTHPKAERESDKKDLPKPSLLQRLTGPALFFAVLGFAILLRSDTQVDQSKSPVYQPSTRPTPPVVGSQPLQDPRIRTRRHEMKLHFEGGYHPTSVQLLDQLRWDDLKKEFALAANIIGSMGDRYLAEQHPNLPSPFRKFSTDLNLDSTVLSIATPDIQQWMKANLPSQALIVGKITDEDAAILPMVKISQTSESTISLIILFDLNRLLEKSSKIHGNRSEGFLITVMAATAHEMIGHMPSILSGQATGDRVLDEVRAFTLSVSFMEWMLEELRNNPKMVEIGVVSGLERMLVKEREMLEDWKKSVK